MDHIDVTPVEKFTSGQILDKIAEIQKLSV
jgi:hypothetical protein